MPHQNNYPTALTDQIRFLPEVEQATLNNNGLFVVKGLNVALAEQLVKQSKDPVVHYYCPSDGVGPYNIPGKTIRFEDVTAVEKWQSKQRLSLPLVKQIGDSGLQLAGFGWMGPGVPGADEPQIDGAKTTFAVRLYELARGQGMATPYTRAIIEAHDQQYGSDGVWLEAWGDNVRAVSSYKKVGFSEVVRVMGERHGEQVERVYMTYQPLDTTEQ